MTTFHFLTDGLVGVVATIDIFHNIGNFTVMLWCTTHIRCIFTQSKTVINIMSVYLFYQSSNQGSYYVGMNTLNSIHWQTRSVQHQLNFSRKESGTSQLLRKDYSFTCTPLRMTKVAAQSTVVITMNYNWTGWLIFLPIASDTKPTVLCSWNIAFKFLTAWRLYKLPL